MRDDVQIASAIGNPIHAASLACLCLGDLDKACRHTAAVTTIQNPRPTGDDPTLAAPSRYGRQMCGARGSRLERIPYPVAAGASQPEKCESAFLPIGSPPAAS